MSAPAWVEAFKAKRRVEASEARELARELVAARKRLAAFRANPRALRASDRHVFINGHSYCAGFYDECDGGHGTVCPGCTWILYPKARPRGMREPRRTDPGEAEAALWRMEASDAVARWLLGATG